MSFSPTMSGRSRYGMRGSRHRLLGTCTTVTSCRHDCPPCGQIGDVESLPHTHDPVSYMLALTVSLSKLRTTE